VAAAAIVPIKRFGSAKSRLAGTSAASLRPALAEAMLIDVLAELGRCRRLGPIIVVSGEPAAAGIARDFGADHVDDPTDAGHSEAAAIGIAHAGARGATVIALLPGDCPLVRAAEIDDALATRADGVTVIPDRHGSGTNGLILSPPDAIPPAFGPGSRERHLELAREVGVAAEVAEIPSLSLDLDTGDDLRELKSALGADRAIAPATAAALALLEAPLR
jgi:2-phospho-L-lactate/phosphoenolpyruvate guanylyltransferase